MGHKGWPKCDITLLVKQGDEFPHLGRVARVVPSVINPIAKIAGSTPAPPTMAEAII